MKAIDINYIQKNEPANTITGLITWNGRMYCRKCSERLEIEGNAMFVMNSHLDKSNTDKCDCCKTIIPVDY